MEGNNIQGWISMLRPKNIIILAMAFLLVPGVAVAEELVVLFTANTNGYVKPCG